MTGTMRPIGWALVAGLAAGALDIVFACSFWAIKAGVPARRILQSVAAGLLGKASFDGGWATAALGLVLHFGIAVVMALAYFLVAREWPLLVQRPLLCGALYGLMLYGVMSFVVVPLSAAAPAPRDTSWVVASVLAHMILVGWPIAALSRHALT